MIKQKTVIVEQFCCELCGEELEEVKIRGQCFHWLHLAFSDVFGTDKNKYNFKIEESPCFLCEECVEKYKKEIFEALLLTYENKLTEIKLKEKR